MNVKNLSTTSSSSDIDQFLTKVEARPPMQSGGAQGRLIFSLDATASRQPTWDQATRLQYDMFTQTSGITQLDLQLVYYRGFNECRASSWINSADKLAALMNKIQCQAGRTQIARVLQHGLAEARLKPVNALVFVGDCMEEDIDSLGNLAGQLKLLGLPLFIFQEGRDAVASAAFNSLAQLAGGAHCRFDHSSAAQLGQLLNAVAVYAAGGRNALANLVDASPQAQALLEQLR